MKKMTSFLKPLAVAIVLLAGVSQANALQLKAVSQVLNPATGGGGHPTWYQDQNSVAVKPAGIPLTGFPAGFPAEFFYFSAVTNTVPLDNSDVFVLFALEASWVLADGSLIPAPGTPESLLPAQQAGLKASTFQRMRMRVRPQGPINPGDPTNLFIPGVYKVDHPWGTTSFTCAGPSGNNASCQETTDITAAVIDPATGTIFGGFNNALGVVPPNAGTFTGMDKFVKAANALPGFLGDGLNPSTITSAGATPLLRTNVVITSPLGTVVTIPNFLVTGTLIGMEITPPVGGTNFGEVGPVTAAVKKTKTFNVNNLTGAIVPALTITASNPEFTISAPLATALPATKACDLGAVATMQVGEICSFDVTFTPNAPDGPKTATISIAGTGAPTAQTTVTGTGDSIAPAPPTLNSTFASVVTTKTSVISGTVEGRATVTVNNLPADVNILPSNATAGTNTTWSFRFGPLPKPLMAIGPNAITVIATDPAGNASVPLTTSITGIAPDGIIAPNATAVSIADAQLALKFVSGLSDLSAEQKVHADVAPLAGGKPTPNGKLDIGDVVLILRKVVEPASW